jgi:hypothetical protein
MVIEMKVQCTGGIIYKNKDIPQIITVIVLQKVTVSLWTMWSRKGDKN